jgi:hypothetical protein
MSARTWIGTTIELDDPATSAQFATGSTWTLSLTTTSTTAPEQSLIAFSTNSGSGRTDSNPLTSTSWAVVEQDGSNYKYATQITIDQAALASSICLYIQFRFADTKTDLDIANVQLEPGPVATPFEHRPYDTELALCQRYYEFSRVSSFGGANEAHTGWRSAIVALKVTKRAIPTIAISKDLHAGLNQVSCEIPGIGAQTATLAQVSFSTPVVTPYDFAWQANVTDGAIAAYVKPSFYYYADAEL